MTTFFTSDLHFGHKNIIEYSHRPFTSVEHMEVELISRWNSVVRQTDEVYVLGDFAMGKLSDNVPLALLLNGIKWLVPGNHDKCWEGHSKVRERDRAMYEDAGLYVQPSEMSYRLPTVPGQNARSVLLCHFPYERDERHGDRYAGHNPVDRGDILLHGHIHDAWRRRGREINVGVDVWDYYPVTLEQLLACPEDE